MKIGKKKELYFVFQKPSTVISLMYFSILKMEGGVKKICFSLKLQYNGILLFLVV